MNKKLLLLGLVILSVVMCTSTVSAYTSYYGSSWPQIVRGQSPYPWVVVGGRTASSGAWASSYMSNLIPGTYYGTPCPTYNAIAYYDASTPCNSGYGGNYNNYGGNYGWGGAWGNYGNYNSYGGNVGWASGYPSYNSNYMYNGYA